MKYRRSKLKFFYHRTDSTEGFSERKKIVYRCFSKFNLFDNSWRIFRLVICDDNSSCHARRFVYCEIPFFGAWVGHLGEGATVKVLSLLPPYEGKSILELGACTGCFTVELAKKVGSIVALDFMEGAIKKNESINGHHKNAKFICADSHPQT